MVKTAIFLLLAGATGFCQGGPKKLTRSEALSSVVSRIPPEYPSIARQLRLEGVVELEVLVAESGAVEQVNIISGNPVLTKPAAEAAKKWKFAPSQEAGKAVKALAPISVTFHL